MFLHVLEDVLVPYTPLITALMPYHALKSGVYQVENSALLRRPYLEADGAKVK